MSENTCIYCGETIPEGRQVCPTCEHNIEDEAKKIRLYDNGFKAGFRRAKFDAIYFLNYLMSKKQINNENAAEMLQEAFAMAENKERFNG